MASFLRKEWAVADSILEADVKRFSEYDRFVLQLMRNRGIFDEKGIADFFNMDYAEGVHSPFLFLRMRDVVERIFAALENGEKIMIYGDYDGDGVCGSAVMIEGLREICEKAGYSGFDDGLINWTLPDREGDGYGLSVRAVDEFAQKGVDLVITVDCGVANTNEIERAYELGMEVIVVDHHQMPEILSEKALIIHPLVPGETYPFKKLAAVGVAYKVVSGLFEVAREREIGIAVGAEKWFLDLVAIATVTDMVPLVGENRIFEHFGLVVLNKTKRLGLRALFDVVGLKSGSLNTVDIGFRIGPRINAAGRVDKADVALELVLASDEASAEELALRLNELNSLRQIITEKATTEALKGISEKSSFIAVVDDSIRIGVAGLVAGKIVSLTNRPSVVMTKVGENYVGSGRGPSGFHFVEAMDSCRNLMIAGGGHPQACGFKLEEEKVESWIEAMDKYAKATMSDKPPVLNVDMELDLEEIGWDLIGEIEKMEPFGIGNPTPVFVTRGLHVVSVERIGKTKKHLRLTVANQDRVIKKCIGFSMGDFSDNSVMGDIIDIAYELNVNEWNGNREIQLQLIDILKV